LFGWLQLELLGYHNVVEILGTSVLGDGAQVSGPEVSLENGAGRLDGNGFDPLTWAVELGK
jgi:hypothetical protein